MGFVPFIRAHPTATRRVALGLVLVVAFVLRVWNLNWDAGTHQHPDERYWSLITSEISAPGPAEYFDSESSPLNPYNLDGRDTWVYGTFPLFSTKAVASFLADGPFPAGALVTAADAAGIDLRTDGIDDFDAGYNANLIGRLLSALIDTATVGLAYLLGRDLFDRRVGFVAATLLAFTPLHIQYAHFYGAEPWVTFFVTLGVWLSLRLARGRLSLAVAAATGLAFGMAAASKLIAAAALVVPATAIFVAVAPALAIAGRWTVTALRRGAPDVETYPAAEQGRAAWQIVGWGALTGFVVLATTAITYRVLQPYTFDGLVSVDDRFTRDLDYLEGVNSGGNVPWVVQWIGRTPLTFPLRSAFWWGMGPALGLAVLVGAAKAVSDVIRRQRWVLLVPLALLVVMLGLVSQQFNPLIRYLLPAYPTAIVLGAFAVVWGWEAGLDATARATRAGKAWSRGARLAAAAVVGLTAFWGLAFVNGVYNTDHPRLEASRWMAENLPEGSAISAQIWDDALPLGIPGSDPARFTIVALDPFRPDAAVDQATGQGKVDELIASLDQLDYVVEASNRVYDSVPRFPARYPATVAYYDALFDGSLGFEEIARFRTAPSLLGIEIADHQAEETFTVYDHPTVTIWQKTPDFSVARAEALLNPASARRAPDVPPSDAATNTLLLTPDRAESIETGATFSELFDDDGPTGTYTWLWWLLWLQLASLATLPWSTALFARLPDKGIGLSKVLGFSVVGLGVWLTVSWEIAPFSAGLAWVWLAAIALFGMALWRRRRTQMAELWARDRGVWLASELVFLVVFGLALWMRSANPDLWETYLGGEKPMELAYLTAIGRTSDLPAPDPWLAGGFMNYYYLGWFLLSVPMRALRILPEVAFNLGVATYAALTAVTTFSVVHNLAGLSRNRWGTAPGDRPARGPIAAGLVGVVLLIGIGNLDALRLHYDRLAAVNEWTTGSDIPVIGHLVTFAGGTWAWISGTPLGRFDFFAPSRVNEGNIDITEFPYFTHLFGDLHPHLMGMTFVGLTVAVAVAYLVASRFDDGGRALAAAAGLGATTGMVRVVNTWDLPSAVIVTAVALVVGRYLVPFRPDADDTRRRGVAAVIAVTGLATGLSVLGGPGGPLLIGIGFVGLLAAVALTTGWRMRRRLLSFIGHTSIAVGVHLLVFWPFLRSNETFETGLQSAADNSPLGDFFVHWGIFVAFGVALVAALLVDARRRRRAGETAPAPLPDVLWASPVWKGVWLGLAAGAVTVAGVLSTGVVAVSLTGTIVFTGLMLVELRRAEHDIGRLVALGLFALGFAISGGVDVVTVQNDVGRMNTVFKFWLQAWQYFAFASGFAAWQVARIVAERPDQIVRTEAADGTHVQFGRTRSARTTAWAGFVLVALLAGLAYPLLGTRTRLETRFAQLPVTLDGLAYLDSDPQMLRTVNGAEVMVSIGDDRPLIDWYRDHVEGTPTIVEWSGQLYDWNARMATHTGLPTVIGWDWHQKQQRWAYQAMVDRRVEDVRRLYTVADQAEITDILQAYDVAYVTVGTQELLYGTPDALAALSTHPALTEVFRSGEHVIYAVDPDLLWT